jgi:ubiquinone/menaquinone biosynthesis C-methylase UbiE
MPLAVAQEPVTDTEPNQRTDVPENINAGFLDAELNPQQWMDRFEIESREIYASQKAIVASLPLKDGSTIADVGAGTGLFLTPFSQAVGASGKVYALDISPRLIEHMQDRAKNESLDNVEVIHSKEDSTTLPADSVDVVFICDTYHHFEYHADMLLSIRNTLRRGGELILIDFERIPDKSREWILGHVRAGKQQFRKEIQQSGFQFIEEVTIPGFEENYFLRFQRP